MEERTKIHVGLDVHKDSITVAVAEPGRAAARLVGKVTHDLAKLLKVLAKLGNAEQLHLVYEAGPTGFGQQRASTARGYACEVIAASRMPKRPGDRVKTDARDGLQLAERSRAGQLSAVWVPDPTNDAIRDLSRAREDAVNSRVQAPPAQGLSAAPRHSLCRQAILEPGLRALVGDAEVRVRTFADGVHGVLARRQVRRCSCRAPDQGIGRIDQGLALRAHCPGPAGPARNRCDHGHRGACRRSATSRASRIHASSWATWAWFRRNTPVANDKPQQHHQDGQRARAATADRSCLELSLQCTARP